ncbi:hypothetical protein Q2T42_05915 [Leptolyngbya boryana CZ1]|uniref:Uncharacterized protein n=1 Tax=Leptolyngbya boryana CZ1 TaxID=3060204 RepID=A0AA96X064_LEPBY|nr:hypothetical protein [Leptolyngbya boryana]WNZ47369.1 hypothetical protein Q2T42_05915 [Leptolyngbya boryana CZ1]
MAYPRFCKYCGQPIIMAQLSSGRWQPWEPDQSGRHQCGDGSTHPSRLSSSTTPETYLTRCSWCREHVYYHTNGNGDTVYFQQLGYPWQIHPCWENYWQHAKNGDRLRKRILNNRDKNKVQLLILQGAIRRIPNITQISIGVYRTTEVALAEQMGLPLEKLREDYGHLYVMTNPSELQIISDRRQYTQEQRTTRPQIEIVEGRSSVSQNQQSELPRVRCPHCGQRVYEHRLENHIQVRHERRHRPFLRR